MTCSDDIYRLSISSSPLQRTARAMATPGVAIGVGRHRMVYPQPEISQSVVHGFCWPPPPIEQTSLKSKSVDCRNRSSFLYPATSQRNPIHFVSELAPSWCRQTRRSLQSRGLALLLSAVACLTRLARPSEPHAAEARRVDALIRQLLLVTVHPASACGHVRLRW